MKDILPSIDQWLSAHEAIALATVVQTWGSSPRGTGAKMAFTRSGKITGSVSGGCVEGAVYEAGETVIQEQMPQLLHFGVADETAWSVGLACGGQIDVFVQPLDETFYTALRAALLAGRQFAIATIIRGPADLLGCVMVVSREGIIYTTPQNAAPTIGAQPTGSSMPRLDQTLIEISHQALAQGRSQRETLRLEYEQEIEVFTEVVEPHPTLVIVGAVHTAIALSKIAQVMGFQTVVIDPRRAFGNSERFPQIDQLIQQWPDDAFKQVPITETTAVAILTHDPKIDDPALLIALRSPAFYIGALGSPSTQEKRRQRLIEAGVSPEQLSHLHGPIGLNLGGKTPEEIALSIMAEITAVQNHTVS